MTAPIVFPRRAKWSGTVTLTTANTKYNLRKLINALLSTATVPEAFRELNIQSHPGIDGVGGNTNDILVGDSTLSTSNIGYVLQSGQSRLYRSDIQNGQLDDIYVQSAGAAQKLNIDFASC